MATQQPEGVAFEQKTMPVPSSDKMALDIDINGNSNLDGPNLDLDSTSPDLVPKIVEISPSNELTSRTDLNGATNNIHSFASNRTIAAPSIDLPTESQPTEEFSVSTENPNSSQLPDTNTTTPVVQPQSPEVQQPFLLVSEDLKPEIASVIDSAAETVIKSALEDNSATSTVLPIIEAQESDLRDTTSPLALAPEVQLESRQTNDLEMEPEFPVHNMDGAIASGESQTLTSPNAPPPADAATSIQDEQPPTTDTETKDTDMMDAPDLTSFPKVSREREDDNEDEPSAKRTKTDGDTVMADVSVEEFQVPQLPASAKNKEVAPIKSESSAISQYEAKEIIKIMKNITRTKDGKNFREPVKTLWPSFSDKYYERVPHPVDLGTMEADLRENKYSSLDAFKADVNLLASNALLFNGENHTITIAGQAVRDALLNKMEAIPPEPVPVPKAPKKQARRSTPLAETAPRATPARRPSRSGGPTPMSGADPSPTFALNPTTQTPLIRRDSTKVDGGRPKREIHPPKNKDLPYTTPRPKNKKATTELKFCDLVLSEMKQTRHAAISGAFMVPVDPVSMGIPNYFQVIKHPMDISTIEKKINQGEYQNAKAFETDMKLMFANCYKFNPPGNPVHHMGKQFEVVFNEVWATKNKWIADHAPPTETPSSNGGSDEEESDEEEEVEELTTGPNSVTALSERLNEEQEKLINMISAGKKENAAMVEMQKEMVELIKMKIATAKATPPAKKATKKAKAPKPARKSAPAKKTGPAATKKSAPARQKYLGTHEKNIISLGIQRLPDDVIKEILAMIKAETEVSEGDDGEVELDIDVVSTPSLWRIYGHVMKHAPEVEAEAKAMLDDKEEEVPRPSLAKPPAKKKNKPMSKTEQERKIEELTKIDKAFERQVSGSQEPIPTVEQNQLQNQAGNETSGDDESDSEEE